MAVPTASTIATEIAAHQVGLLTHTRRLFGKTNLDIGCGNGLTSVIQQQEMGISPTLCDVIDIRDSSARAFPFSLIRRGRLPFPDQAFDTSYLQYVLHHLPTERAVARLLTEARRVARRVIIVEEITGRRTNLARAKEFDREVNQRIHPGVKMKVYKYYSRKDIEQRLNGLGLKVRFHAAVSRGSAENGFLETRVFAGDSVLVSGF